jgi:hypothetical protein
MKPSKVTQLFDKISMLILHLISQIDFLIKENNQLMSSKKLAKNILSILNHNLNKKILENKYNRVEVKPKFMSPIKQ